MITHTFIPIEGTVNKLKFIEQDLIQRNLNGDANGNITFEYLHFGTKRTYCQRKSEKGYCIGGNGPQQGYIEATK